MKHTLFLLQITLCIVLAISFAAIKSRENLRYRSVGNFGAKNIYNDTFEELCQNICKDVFYE